MRIKENIGIAIQTTILLLVILITIRLSGHKHSLGVLVIGLFFIDLIALFIGAILRWTRIITVRNWRIFISLVALTFVTFILYHRSYDSYHETRYLFWGLNGETREINAR
jgi:hypothetical protein